MEKYKYADFKGNHPRPFYTASILKQLRCNFSSSFWIYLIFLLFWWSLPRVIYRRFMIKNCVDNEADQCTLFENYGQQVFIYNWTLFADSNAMNRFSLRGALDKESLWLMCFPLSCDSFLIHYPHFCFVFMCYRVPHVGCFLIPYLICLVFAGVPVLILEVCLGQFASQGGITAWLICPLFQGLF